MDRANRIVIYIDNLERYRFFKKTFGHLHGLGYHVFVFTAHYGVYRQVAKDAQVEGELLCYQSPNATIAPINVSQTLSVLSGYHDPKEAIRISVSVYAQLRSALHEEVDQIWLWNGTTTIGRTLRAYAKDNGIQIRIFEIANLPHKVFVDPWGIAGESYLYRYPEVLDNLSDPGVDAFSVWRAGFVRGYRTPKQVQNRTRLPLGRLWEVYGWLRFRSVREDRRSILRMVYRRLKNKILATNLVEAEAGLPNRYVFLPLQVSNDAQVKLFSRYDNEAMIFQALKRAKSLGASLIIKTHPAEDDRREIERIRFLCTKHGAILSNQKTLDLIEGACEVVVNNSTVGLEAMIMQKSVRVYGEAVYKHFDPVRLRKYILNYLSDADYFGDTPIKKEVVAVWVRGDLWKR